MASTADVFIDAFGRVRDTAHQLLDGLGLPELTYRVDGTANSVAWLVWHTARVQDDHVADVADTEQVWTSDGWAERFALPFDNSATGYGQSSDEVAAVQASSELLLGYLDAVTGRTGEFLRDLTDADFDRVVDEKWDPPVSLAVRIVSVLDDGVQHIGQAAFVRGLQPPKGSR